jgi:hypothetical protein
MTLGSIGGTTNDNDNQTKDTQDTGQTRRAKAATNQASGEPKREISDIERLVTRWRFLEAEEAYQATIAKTDEESNALVCQHMDEENEIEEQLATLVPETFQEVSTLLKFAIDLTEDGPLTNGADVMMLRNAYEGLQSVWCDKGDVERKAAAVEMRDGLSELLDLFNKPGHLRILRDALAHPA